MNEKRLCNLPAELIVREGVSKRSGKPYRMTIVRILADTEEVEIVLDTRTDRAGIILDMLARKEERNG